MVPWQQLPASAYAAGSSSRACNLGPAQSYAVGRFLLRRLRQGRSGQMLCGADCGLCPLHIPSQPPRAMLGRTSCLRYSRLWESWCHCCACGYLWWLEGCGHAISCTSPNPLLPSSCQVQLCRICRTFCHTFCHSFLLTLGVVPNGRASNLRHTPSLPPPAPSERLAATPQREFWLPVVI